MASLILYYFNILFLHNSQFQSHSIITKQQTLGQQLKRGYIGSTSTWRNECRLELHLGQGWTAVLLLCALFNNLGKSKDNWYSMETKLNISCLQTVLFVLTLADID